MAVRTFSSLAVPCDPTLSRATPASSGPKPTGTRPSLISVDGRSCPRFYSDKVETLSWCAFPRCTNVRERYARIATDVENPPQNSAFVLQWMLHARLRERLHARAENESCPHDEIAAPSVGDSCSESCRLRSAILKLRTAMTLEAVAEAVEVRRCSLPYNRALIFFTP